jgi:CheY-like chemotaxis protein
MNGILGFTQLLKDSTLEASLMKKYLNIIQKSGDRMLSTIDDIIEISKIETGQVRINKIKVNFNEIIKDYFDFFIPEANEKNIELEYHNPLPDNLAIIVTDRQMFNSILTNLLKNAIKYTKKGSISFGYSVYENEIEFYVKDSGIGISEDEQEIIFERFRQSSVPKSEVYEGSGLGLAISKAYLDLLGGKIWVESKKEVGSTFYFSLPFSKVQIDQSEPSSKSNKKTASKLGDKSILIVEDDVFGMMLLREILDPLVSKLYEAPSGNIALDFINNNPIDIILMDIKIPDIDGISLTKKIRETNRDVIIIAQTAYAMAGDKDEAITAGCDGYITKPINPTELVNMLNSAIQ